MRHIHIYIYIYVHNRRTATTDSSGRYQNHPPTSRAALRLGVSLHDQGDPVNACNYYYRAIQLDPRNKAAYNNLGACMMHSHV